MSIKVVGLPAASSKGKRFISDVTPKGVVFKSLKGWSKRIVDNYQDLADRTKQLADVGKRLESADEAEMMELTKQVDKIKSSNNKAFERDVDKITKALSSYPDTDEYPKFIDDEVARTQELADFILTDKNWVTQVRGILPEEPDAIKVAIHEIEDVVKGLSHEKPEQSFFDKLMGSKGTEARTELGQSLKETQDSIRHDLEYLKLHRQSLNKVMYFYDGAYNFYIDIHDAAMQQVNNLKEEVEAED